MQNPQSDIDPLVRSVAEFIDDRGLIAPGAAVVGVSGGADSVCLLAVLRELSVCPERYYRLTVGHLSHGIRPEAQADADWVADIARRWQLPCIVESCDVPARARDEGRGIEEAARDARYDFLSRAAATAGASVVAVGHHADDNVETVLYRIARGTHLRGLAGIVAQRPLGSVTLVRPLLHCRREEVEAYCRRAGLEWRTDPTNADTAYRRNFIRHELLPLLRDRLNPRADEAVTRLAVAAGEVDAYLSAEAARATSAALRHSDPDRIVLDATKLAGEADVVQRAALRCALERLSAPMRKITAQRLDELRRLCDGPGSVALAGGFAARRERDELIVERVREAHDSTEQSAPLACPGRTVLADGREIVCEILDHAQADFDAHCRSHEPGVELLDAAGISGPLTCRPRRDGDQFHPLGSPGRQSVSDFLTNRKLPRRRREAAWCICDDQAIVYLAPLRIAERVKITPQTRRVVRIRILDVPPGR